MIRVYIFSFRNRWGESGAILCKSKAEQIGHLGSWLENDSDDDDGEGDLEKFNSLLKAGEIAKAEKHAEHRLTSSGHEWIFDHQDIDPALFETIKPAAPAATDEGRA